MSELQGLQLSKSDLATRGCRVVGIAVDTVEENATLARAAALEFQLLSDRELHMLDAYGLRHVAGHDGTDIALSASVLIDAAGIVRWTSVARNFRVRPTPAEVLAALDTHVLGR